MAEDEDAEVQFEARWNQMQDARNEAKQLKETNTGLRQEEARHQAEAEELEARMSSDEEDLEVSRNALVVEVDEIETKHAELEHQKAELEAQLAVNQSALDSSRAALSRAEQELRFHTRARRVEVRKSRQSAADLANLREKNEAKIRALYATNGSFNANNLHETVAKSPALPDRPKDPSETAMNSTIESNEPTERTPSDIVRVSSAPTADALYDASATDIEQDVSLPEQGEYLESFPNVVFIGGDWWLTECPLCHANQRAKSKEFFHGIKSIIYHASKMHGQQDVDWDTWRDRCKVSKYSTEDVQRMRQGQQPTVPIIGTHGDGSHRREDKQDSVLQVQDSPSIRSGPADVAVMVASNLPSPPPPPPPPSSSPPPPPPPEPEHKPEMQQPKTGNDQHQASEIISVPPRRIRLHDPHYYNSDAEIDIARTIHRNFPMTSQIEENPRWHEICCAICGANFAGGTYFIGTAGLREHVLYGHPSVDVTNVNTWLDYRRLSDGDTKLMRRGESPQFRDIVRYTGRTRDNNPPVRHRLSGQLQEVTPQSAKTPRLPNRPLDDFVNGHSNHKRQRSEDPDLPPEDRRDRRRRLNY